MRIFLYYLTIEIVFSTLVLSIEIESAFLGKAEIVKIHETIVVPEGLNPAVEKFGKLGVTKVTVQLTNTKILFKGGGIDLNSALKSKKCTLLIEQISPKGIDFNKLTFKEGDTIYFIASTSFFSEFFVVTSFISKKRFNWTIENVGPPAVTPLPHLGDLEK